MANAVKDVLDFNFGPLTPGGDSAIAGLFGDSLIALNLVANTVQPGADPSFSLQVRTFDAAGVLTAGPASVLSFPLGSSDISDFSIAAQVIGGEVLLTIQDSAGRVLAAGGFTVNQQGLTLGVEVALDLTGTFSPAYGDAKIFALRIDEGDIGRVVVVNGGGTQLLATLDLTADARMVSAELADASNVLVIDQDGAAGPSTDFRIILVDDTGTVTRQTVLRGDTALSDPAVTALARGGFAVAGVDQLPGGDSQIVLGMFDAAGDPLSGLITVGSPLPSVESAPQVVALDDGGFVVFYENSATPAVLSGQRFDALGVGVAAPFQIAAPGGATDWDYSATARSDTGFAVAFALPDGTVQVEVLEEDAATFVDDDGPDTLGGSEADEHFNGGDGGDRLIALGGDDTVFGGEGDDTLEGGDGQDVLVGGIGNDVLDGGSGDSTILGGEGDDVIIAQGGESLLDGGAGNDTITSANVTNDTIFGGLGDDLINLGSGHDVVHGGEGNDTIDARNGNSGTFFGDAGDDVIDILEGNATADGGTGNDLLHTGKGHDSLQGGEGNDTILAGRGRDTVDGGDGDDSLNGEADDDRIAGGAGNDTIQGGTGNDTVFGGDGDDVFIGSEGIDLIEGGDGIDTLDYSAQTGDLLVFLAAGDGDDTLGSVENLVGGSGNDELHGRFGANTIEGGAGNDTIYGEGGADRLIGGDGDDTFVLEAGDDIAGALFNGGDGVDTLLLTGEVRLYDFTSSAIAGVERLLIRDVVGVSGQFRADQFQFQQIEASNFKSIGPILIEMGNAGLLDLSQVLFGENLVNLETLITGSNLGEVIIGSSQADEIYGNGGGDVIEGGRGADSMEGGAGRDTLSYAGSAEGVTVRLLRGTVSGGDGEGDEFTSFENVLGSAQNDRIDGLGGANVIHGGDGIDVINGFGGADELFGEAGNDRFVVLAQREHTGATLDGGEGFDDLMIAGLAGVEDFTDDTLEGIERLSFTTGLGRSYEASFTAEQFGFTHVRGTSDARGGDDITINIAMDGSLALDLSGLDLTNMTDGDGIVITGGAAAEEIRGSALADTINGGAGDDSLIGGARDDRLNGDAGDDTLLGEAGDDSLRGGDGNDVLNSGTGSDELDGGDGDDLLFSAEDGETDSFVFRDGYGNDTIARFEQGTDVLLLDTALVAELGFAPDGQDVVDAFGVLNGTGTVLTLDFGDGDVLRLANTISFDLATLGDSILMP